MRLTEFVRRFKPRDDRFFNALERHGELLGTASGCLVAFADRRTHVGEAANAVRALEPESASRLRALEGLVGATYGSPLDPGDLHALGQGMHEVIGSVDVALDAVAHLEHRDAPPYLRAQLRHLGLLVDLVARHVPHLRTGRFDVVVRTRTDARRLARAARECHASGVHGLLEEGGPTAEVSLRVLAAHEGGALAVAATTATASRLRAVALKYT